jgi:hypothetical protein
VEGKDPPIEIAIQSPRTATVRFEDGHPLAEIV